MFPSPPKPRFQPGTRVRVIQHVRVGHRRWRTEVTGRVRSEAVRPVGGMEMGAKALFCRQPTLVIERDDGELTTVAVDENTEVLILNES